MVIIAFMVLEFILDHKLAPMDDGRGSGGLLRGIRWPILRDLGASTALVWEGELWRIMACTFLHGGILHVLMNGWVLFSLGQTCEPLMGTQRFLATYLTCGLLSSLASVGYHRLTDFPFGSVGASGALAGLIGLLLGFSIRQRDRMLRTQIVQNIIFIAVITMMMPHVDHAGHIGGLLTGMAFGWFLPRYTASSTSKRWRVPCWILCGITAASLLLAVWNNFKDAI